jgi:hypothetical protein
MRRHFPKQNPPCESFIVLEEQAAALQPECMDYRFAGKPACRIVGKAGNKWDRSPVARVVIRDNLLHKSLIR